MATIVSVSDLPLSARIGINPDEVGREQVLIISVNLTLADGARGATLADSVDYRRIVAEAEALATGHIGMIEVFARTLAERCLALGPVREAIISVKKPQALARGLAAVRVTVTSED